MTLENFKQIMIEKAVKKGSIWENFGQKELTQLKEKYHYNQYANENSNEKEYEICLAIEELGKWASHFDLSQIKSPLERIRELKREIIALQSNDDSDIDETHHLERMKALKDAKEELHQLNPLAS